MMICPVKLPMWTLHMKFCNYFRTSVMSNKRERLATWILFMNGFGLRSEALYRRLGAGPTKTNTSNTAISLWLGSLPVLSLWTCKKIAQHPWAMSSLPVDKYTEQVHDKLTLRPTQFDSRVWSSEKNKPKEQQKKVQVTNNFNLETSRGTVPEQIQGLGVSLAKEPSKTTWT